jgi:ribose 5-phosphate isomerase B
MKPTVYLGTDHGGFELKEQLKAWLVDQGYEVADCGAHELVPDDDYPLYAFTVAESVITDLDQAQPAKGILLCRTGGGMVIAANKVPGVRAVEVATEAEVEHAVDDNGAHIIALGADSLAQVSESEAIWPRVQRLVTLFLQRDFPGEARHQRRLTEIAEYEDV